MHYPISKEGVIAAVVSYQVIGSHLKNARRRLDLLQADVAERAGITQAYYGKIERGAIKPNIDRLADLCQVLCIPLESVFQGAFVPEGSLLDNLPAPAEEFEVYMNEIGQKVDTRTKLILMRICGELSNLGPEMD